MSNEVKQNLQDEAFVDAAAVSALGTQTAEEAAVFARTLAQATPAQQRTARELRETVSKMAAASPYMEPSDGLRGRILTATAPATFKMADYRRSHEVAPRYLRWGLIAATVFLVAAAYYNVSLQTTVKNQQQQIAQMHQAMKDQTLALNVIANPKSEQINLTQNNQVVAKTLVDEATRTAVLIMPASLVEKGRRPVVSLDHNGTRWDYHTIVITGSPATFGPGAATTQGTQPVVVSDPQPMQQEIKIAGWKN